MKMPLCPLRKTAVKTDVGTTKEYFEECEAKNCMWYIPDVNECAITAIATKLGFGRITVDAITS